MVVLSGGQDSTICLYWALSCFGGPAHVHTISFDYGQKHRIELDSAKEIAAMAKVSWTLLPIDTFSALGGNRLVDDSIQEDRCPHNMQLPNTFVPGRNLIFLGFAAAFAYQLHSYDLVMGVSQTDYSNYPDCREETLTTMASALSLGLDHPIRIHAPLMHRSKAESVDLAMQVGAMAALAYSHTCYEGQTPPCGSCRACLLRAKGFSEAGIEDPLILRTQKASS